MLIKHIVIGILITGTAVCASAGERYTKKHQLDVKHMVVVAEGDYEPRSIGSYSIRLYKILSAEYPTDNYVCGFIRPRDGVVENVLFEDLDENGTAEIIVIMRCAGTGSYISADAFKYAKEKLALLVRVEQLDNNADFVAALKLQLKKQKH